MKKSLIAMASIGLAAAASISPVPTSGSVQPVAQASQQTPAKQVPAPQDQQRTTKRVRRLYVGYGMTRSDTRRAGPGWTNRHVKRMAVKARNVKRHRAACR